MKRIFPFLLTVAILLCLLSACQGGTSAENELLESAENELLEFQGISWNSTPEEVWEVLSISPEERQETYEETEHEGGCDYYYMGIEGRTFFGEETMLARFVFVDWNRNGGPYGLAYIEIFYPEDTDMEAVRAALTDEYGADVDSYMEYTWSPDAGVEEQTVEPGEQAQCWVTGESLENQLSQEAKEGARVFLCEREVEPFSEEDYTLYMKNPAATLICTENAYPRLDPVPEGWSRNMVAIEANNLVMLLQRFGEKQ